MINNTHTSFDFLHTIFFSQNTWFFYYLYTWFWHLYSHLILHFNITWFAIIYTLDFSHLIFRFHHTWFSVTTCTFVQKKWQKNIHLIFQILYTWFWLTWFNQVYTWFSNQVRVIDTPTLDFKFHSHTWFLSSVHLI